jgi:hypothetical protein
MSMKNSNDIIGNRTRNLPACRGVPQPTAPPQEKTCILIDVAMPANRNVTQKDAEKKRKYKSLCTEVKGMWNMKCMIIPVIIGVTGIVTKGLKKTLEAIPGKHSIDSLLRQLYLEHHT